MSNGGPPCVAAVRDAGERQVRNGEAYSTTRVPGLLDVDFDPLSFVFIDHVHDLAAHTLALGLGQLAELDPFHIGDEACSYLEPDVDEPHRNGDVHPWFAAEDVGHPDSQPARLAFVRRLALPFAARHGRPEPPPLLPRDRPLFH